jgi:hypothetical protein
MGFNYWLRAGMMILALIGVLLLMQQFNHQPGKVSPLERVFGRDAANMTEREVNLCPTRITRLELGDGTALAQEGMTWFRVVNGLKQELDQVSMEKWFGSNCVVRGRSATASADVSKAFTAHFVSGQPVDLLKSNSQAAEYEWQGQSFKSEDLERALLALKDINVHATAPTANP